jgi:hypothetical protein
VLAGTRRSRAAAYGASYGIAKRGTKAKGHLVVALLLTEPKHPSLILDASDRISATVTGSALRPLVRSIARLGCMALCAGCDDRIATTAGQRRVTSAGGWCGAA